MAGKYEPISIYLTATGEIVGTAYKFNGVVDGLDAGKNWIDGIWESEDYWVNGGVLTERVGLIDDDEPIYIDRADVVYTLIPSIPIGTIVQADDFYEEAATAQVLNVMPSRAGEFEIIVTPPFPSKELNITLVISRAD